MANVKLAVVVLFGGIPLLAMPGFAATTAADYYNQANDEREHGVLEVSVNDYTKAIELNGANGAAVYLLRGAAYYELQRWADALSDFRKTCELSPEADMKPRLFVWAARGHLGEVTAATKDLSDFIEDKRKREQLNSTSPTPTVATERFDSAVDTFEKGHRPTPAIPRAERVKQRRDWPSTIADFLRGNTTESEFFLDDLPPRYTNGVIMPFRPAGTQSCSAWFYAGLKRLFNGDRRKAMDYFMRASTADGESKLDREFARSELKAMKSGG